jgi:membrane protein YqaA with SNARE-associated domain
MDESSNRQPDPPQSVLPDEVSVLRWFVGYGLGLAAALAVTILLASRYDWQTASWLGGDLGFSQRWQNFLAVVAGAPVTVKLLVFAIYISLCTTFFPLPTGGIVAALATREAALAAGLGLEVWAEAAVTTLIAATVGAAASMVANLNDYHLFTWLLRSDRVGAVRRTKLYARAIRWFRRSPFFLLVVFNILPIPIDLVRLLAVTWRYPRGPFAVANFVGRFIRYGVIAFVTYWWNLGWVAVTGLLAFAILLALAKGLLALVRKTRETNEPAGEVSE